MSDRFGMIGRYSVVRVIGEGRSGIVYVADDAEAGRQVALRVINLVEQTPEARDGFLDDLRKLSRLDGDRIVPILEVGREGDSVFCVMPLCDSSLSEQIHGPHGEGIKMPVADVAAVTSAVASALGSLHQQGIIHGQVKPANILFFKGRWLLADGGLAQALHKVDRSRHSNSGSAAYASPEQCKGDNVAANTDLYSLATVVFECLTGSLPFVGATDGATAVAKTSQDAPDPRSLRNDLPENVVLSLISALTRDPIKRPTNPAILVEPLRHPTKPAAAAAAGAKLSYSNDPFAVGAGAIQRPMDAPVSRSTASSGQEWAPARRRSEPKKWPLALLVLVLLGGGAFGAWKAGLFPKGALSTPAAKQDDFASVTLCSDTHHVATKFCPHTVVVKMKRSDIPPKCEKHVRPTCPNCGRMITPSEQKQGYKYCPVCPGKIRLTGT